MYRGRLKPAVKNFRRVPFFGYFLRARKKVTMKLSVELLKKQKKRNRAWHKHDTCPTQ